MKEFFKKHDLFKILGICLVFTVLLTWILRYSSFQNGDLTTFADEVSGIQTIVDGSTIGIFDINTYSVLVLYYFTNLFVFLLSVFAFYKVLGKSKVYNALIEKIAGVFKKKEILFALISMILYAVLASMIGDYIILFAFIPFSISIFSKLKVDKISTLASTFGGVMLGVLGTTYSAKIAGTLINTVGLATTYTSELFGKLIIAIIALIALATLVIIRIKSKNKYEETEDKFIEVKETKKKTKGVVLLGIALAVYAIVILLAFMPWKAWGVTAFTELHNAITSATILGGNYPIVFLGEKTLLPFGEWDLFTLTAFVILMTFIVKSIGKVSFNELIEGAEDGLKLSIKPLALVGMALAIVIFAVAYPVLPSIVHGIVENLNQGVMRPVGLFLGGLLPSLFTTDFTYTMVLVGEYFATLTPASVIAVALITSFGFAGFVAPTSLMLILGLSTLDIRYSDYFKFIWKFLLALFVITLVVLYILLYI